MSVYQYGTAINLVAKFATVDPDTLAATPADPSTVTFTLQKPDGTEVTYTFGVDDNVTNPETGVFVCALEPPVAAGNYAYRYTGTGTVEAAGEGAFTVQPSGVLDISSSTVPAPGPCLGWTTGADVLALLQIDAATDVAASQRADWAADAASGLLYEISGRKWAGQCQQTVRPCMTPCQGWGLLGWPSQAFYWGWSAGGPWGWTWGWWGQDGRPLCGCQPLSQVPLPGYPVTEIVEVKIDGAALPELDGSGNPNWRLDGYMRLTRMDDPATDPPQPRFWPGCQDLALDDTQPGTFSIAYRFGAAPPQAGVLAAQQLGGEIYKQISGLPCALPVGATRVDRQGVSITRGLLPDWGLQALTRGGQVPRTWHTGLALVDAFLAAYAPYGNRRPSVIISPDLEQVARRLG